MRRIDQGQKKVALKLDKKAGEEEMHAIMKACREVCRQPLGFESTCLWHRCRGLLHRVGCSVIMGRCIVNHMLHCNNGRLGSSTAPFAMRAAPKFKQSLPPPPWQSVHTRT